VVEPPFTVGLRLSLELPSSAGQQQSPATQLPWRDAARVIAIREVSSRTLPADVVPSDDEANRILRETFASHPSVNIAKAIARPDEYEKPGSVPGVAYVVAEIVLLPDLAPIPPGGEFPDVTEQPIGEPILVRKVRWANGSAEAEMVLEEVVAHLPEHLWRRDG
jgi:hypothetical protein